MHHEVIHFLSFIHSHFSSWFEEKIVLDVGAADLNGNNRAFFKNCQYIGNDVYPGVNVSIVCPTAELPFAENTFDTIISSECFEHDMHYIQSLRRIISMLKPGGLFVFTCASVGREEHGTRRCGPEHSYTCFIGDIAWADYYKNLTTEDIKEAIPCDSIFSSYAFYYNQVSKDLYFYGIKHVEPGMNPIELSVPIYESEIPGDVYDVTHGSTTLKKLTSILNKYNTDKNATFHNYGKYYERYLSIYQKKPIRYLEIGVYQGESLRAMREYFENAERVVGIDINPQTKQHEDIERGVFVEIGNQSNRDFLMDVYIKHGPFDIILDDGSHVVDDMVTSFRTMFPLLKNGGVYIVEDTICIRENLGYFQGLVTYLNRWRADGGGDHCVDPNKIRIQIDDPMEYSIGDIVFTNSAILIFKEVKHHWIKTLLEKQIYSTAGQDGITEYILEKIGFTNKICIEFGAESGLQCNTRYIKEKYNMQNLWLDCHHEAPHIHLYKEFVTRENIVSIFQKYNVPMSFDVLSIDIDGNDWYVLYELLQASYKPRLIICEYNSVHSPTDDKVIIYDPSFIHDGSDYFGASLLALKRLMNQFGYSLVRTDSKGIDSFYVLQEYSSMFEDTDQIDKLYNSPKYKFGDGTHSYGHTPDPLYRPYLSSKQLLNVQYI